MMNLKNTVTYNQFHKPTSIVEGNIYGETGIVAILVKTSTSTTDLGAMYYVLTDHLGSYNMILDQNKNVKDSLHFDPWGNRKRYEDWSRNDTRTSFHFDRGFTGHEHLDRFKIINMNGRLYDPLLARFFSPDPYVQMPDFTQNYNRYSYCLNNPLMYTDPDGEWVHIVVGAVIGGIVNLATNWNDIDGFWQGVASFGIGAAAGVLGAGVGAGIGSAVVGGSFGAGFVGSSAALTSTGFVAGMASGMGAGLSSGFVLGAGNSWMGGNNFGQGLLDGFKGGVIGGITGGIMGGIDAASKGRDFWTGSFKQYDLTPNYIASAGNELYDQYSFPDNATVANMDKYNVYYKPEEGPYGIDNVVKPGKYIDKPVDGIATSKSTEMVFKIPGKWGTQPQAFVLNGGEVGLCVGGRFTRLAMDFQMWRNPNYTYGWMSLGQLDSSWDMLFKLSLLIR